jgi:hypothetical protein
VPSISSSLIIKNEDVCEYFLKFCLEETIKWTFELNENGYYPQFEFLFESFDDSLQNPFTI